MVRFYMATVCNITAVLFDTGFVPKKGYLEKLVKEYPNFNDRKYMKKATQEEKDAMSAAMKDVINDKGEKVDLEPFPLQ